MNKLYAAIFILFIPFLSLAANSTEQQALKAVCEPGSGKPGYNPAGNHDREYCNQFNDGSLKWLDSRLSELIDALRTKGKLKEHIPAVERIKTGISQISEYSGTQNKWTGSFGLNYATSTTEDLDDEVFDMDFHFNVEKNTYPDEFRMKAKFRVREQDGEIEDNVNQLAISYDRYFNEHIEGFVFAERLSSEKMHISERWETGGGFKWEYNLGSSHSISGNAPLLELFSASHNEPFQTNYWKTGEPRGNPLISSYLGTLYYKDAKVHERYACKYTEQLLDAKGLNCESRKTAADDNPANKAGKTPTPGNDTKVVHENEQVWQSAFAANLENTLSTFADKNFRRGFKRTNSFFRLGLTAAFLQEYVDGTVPISGSDDLEDISLDISVPSETNSVFSSRLSAKIRPGKNLSFYAYHFHKNRLNGTSEYRRDNRSNYYTHSGIDITYTVANSINLTLAYSRYFENAPFAVSSEMLVEALDELEVVEQLVNSRDEFQTAADVGNAITSHEKSNCDGGYCYAPATHSEVALIVSVPF